MFSVFFDTMGRSRAIAQVTGAQGTAEVGEGGQDLLVGGVIGQRGRRPGRSRRLAVVVAGEGDEGLAGDLQVADRLAELAQPWR